MEGERGKKENRLGGVREREEDSGEIGWRER